MLPPAPSPTPKPAPTTPQTKSSPTAGIEPLDLSIRGSSMPANPVSTPNCGPGSPVSSPFGNTTPSWANDSLNSLANWIHSVDTPEKPPTNLDTDSDCIMIVDEETTTKPKTTESKPETSGSSAPVHRPVKSIPETSKSKPEPTESKSLFQNMSMLLAIYETSPLPKLNKDRLSLRPKAQPIKRWIPMRLSSEDESAHNGSFSSKTPLSAQRRRRSKSAHELGIVAQPGQPAGPRSSKASSRSSSSVVQRRHRYRSSSRSRRSALNDSPSSSSVVQRRPRSSRSSGRSSRSTHNDSESSSSVIHRRSRSAPRFPRCKYSRSPGSGSITSLSEWSEWHVDIPRYNSTQTTPKKTFEVGTQTSAPRTITMCTQTTPGSARARTREPSPLREQPQPARARPQPSPAPRGPSPTKPGPSGLCQPGSARSELSGQSERKRKRKSCKRKKQIYRNGVLGMTAIANEIKSGELLANSQRHGRGAPEATNIDGVAATLPVPGVVVRVLAAGLLLRG